MEVIPSQEKCISNNRELLRNSGSANHFDFKDLLKNVKVSDTCQEKFKCEYRKRSILFSSTETKNFWDRFILNATQEPDVESVYNSIYPTFHKQVPYLHFHLIKFRNGKVLFLASVISSKPDSFKKYQGFYLVRLSMFQELFDEENGDKLIEFLSN